MDSKLENLLKKENPLDFIKKNYISNFKSPLKPLNIGFAPEEGLPKHTCNYKYMAQISPDYKQKYQQLEQDHLTNRLVKKFRKQ